jgi:single-stranded-DNA-specific exonuclease
MSNKRWEFKQAPNAIFVDSLISSLNVSPANAKLLAMRGVQNFEEAKHFFRPSLDDLHDPFLMKDMAKAVERIEMAIENKEKIMIYGDYDVDGTTSVSMMYGFISKYLYTDVAFYIPDRYKEGYGVQQPGIDFASDNGITLIISIDCGIKSVDKIEYAKTLGIDFIICDHHRPGDELPAAVAILDPKQDDCYYPFDELTGCGVGFKLLTAYCQKHNIDFQYLLPYLDLVCTSIACDIVPVNGENRILSYFGLKYINENPRIGIKALMHVAGHHKMNMDITDVVFKLGPRINAAGRVAHAYDAVNLLLSDNEEEANEFASLIAEHNTDRRELDSKITDEALMMIANNDTLRLAKSTVLFNNNWHKGVIGIVASRCIEKFHRPTIILTEANGHAAGSARSVPGFDVYNAIDACSSELIQFGGHAFAAGLTLHIDKIEAFRNKFEEVVSATISKEQLKPVINIDLPLHLSEIDDKFVRVLHQMAPFGPQNMTPNFVAENVKIKGNPRILKEKHLKLEVYQDESPTFGAIGFGMVEEFYDMLVANPICKICFQIEFNEFRGVKNIQLMIKDIKPM